MSTHQRVSFSGNYKAKVRVKGSGKKRVAIRTKGNTRIKRA